MMLKKNPLVVIISIFYILLSSQSVLAGTTPVSTLCDHSHPDDCVPGYSCRREQLPGSTDYICQPRLGITAPCDKDDPDPCVVGASCRQDPTILTDTICTLDPRPAPPAQPPAAPPNPVASVFGIIQPPEALRDFLRGDPTGAGAISKFLSNLVALIYVAAAIVLIFMLLWGAFDWLTSEGEKEKIQAAQKKIISALIGILLFAVAFAIIKVLGIFTGFKFF